MNFLVNWSNCFSYLQIQSALRLSYLLLNDTIIHLFFFVNIDANLRIRITSYSYLQTLGNDVAAK